METREDNVTYTVHLIIDKAPLFSTFLLSNIVGETKKDTNFEDSILKDAIRLIKSMEYVTETEWGSNILTRLGREIKESGGYYEYLNEQYREEKKLKKKEKAEYQNILISTKVNEYLYKTRWLPHCLSMIALVISVFALLKNCEGDKQQSTQHIENKK